jgi:hypothetical protein
MAPVIGLWFGRMISTGILLPEGLVFPRFLEKGMGGIGAPYLQMANYCMPLGSIILGSLIGFAAGKTAQK